MLFLCLSPVPRKNLNFGLLHLKGVNTTTQMTSVKCGHCAECIAQRQMYYSQRVVVEGMRNHLFYGTLTYQDSMMPVLTTSNGYKIRYADVSDFTHMIKRIRKDNLLGRPFRYFAVTELGSKRGRPHFHFILSVKKYDTDTYNDVINLTEKGFKLFLSEWRRNISKSTKHPIYKDLCRYVVRYTRQGVKRTYDFQYIDSHNDNDSDLNVAFYIQKYMLKPSDKAVRLQRALRLNLPEDEYENIWSIVKPRVFKSTHFGDDDFDSKDKCFTSFDVENYIEDCINRSPRDKFPMFINPNNGSTFPLSPYYRRRFLTLDKALEFPDPNKANMYDSAKNPTEIDNLIKHYEKIQPISDSDCFDFDF